VDQSTLFNVIGFASIPVWMGVIFVIARRQERHWAWMFCGVLQLIGLAFVVAWFFWIKPARDRRATLQEQYARGLIGEEEYRLAMTSTDRAA
jgi:hypothetical protein